MFWGWVAGVTEKHNIPPVVPARLTSGAVIGTPCGATTRAE